MASEILNTDRYPLSVRGDEIGLVLAGGGTKGAYEIGAWRALEEAGAMAQITGISGSSIGAFNSALFANGDLPLAEKIWRSMEQADFADLNEKLVKQKFADAKGHSAAEAFLQNIRIGDAAMKAAGKLAENAGEQIGSLLRRFLRPDERKQSRETDGEPAYNKKIGRDFAVWFMHNLLGSGFAEPVRLREILENNLPPEFPGNLNARVFSTVCRWNAEEEYGGEAEYISWEGKTREEILDLIIASASLPILYPQQDVGGQLYVDGGYADNEPVRPLYDAGYRKIFIIYLDRYDGEKFEKIVTEQERVFPDCEFLRLIPNEQFRDGFIQSCMISQKKTEANLQMGLSDCRKLLEEV